MLRGRRSTPVSANPTTAVHAYLLWERGEPRDHRGLARQQRSFDAQAADPVALAITVEVAPSKQIRRLRRLRSARPSRSARGTSLRPRSAAAPGPVSTRPRRTVLLGSERWNSQQKKPEKGFEPLAPALQGGALTS